MKQNWRLLNKVLRIICIVIVFAEEVTSTELDLKQVIELALKNNPSVIAEELELHNQSSEVKKHQAEYIPCFLISGNTSITEDQPGFEGLRINGRHFSASIKQKIPLGGEFTISNSYQHNTYSSYESDITSYRFTNYNLESYHTTSTVPGKNVYLRESALSFTQPVLKSGLWGPAFFEIKTAQQQRVLQEWHLGQMRMELIENVKLAFYEVVKYKRQVEVAEEGKIISQKLLALAESRYKLGLTTEQEVTSARIELRDAEAVILVAHQQVAFAQKNLQNILNSKERVEVSNQQIKSAFSQKLDEAIVKGADLIQHIADATAMSLRNNRKLQGLKEQIELQKLLVEMANNQRLPALDFIAQYKRSGSGESFEEANDLTGNDTLVGLTLSYPFLNKRANENYTQQVRNLEKAKLALSASEIQVENSVANTIAQLNYIEKRIRNREKQLTFIKEYFSYSLKALEEGFITQDKVYLIRDQLLEAELLYHSAQVERHQLWARFDSLLGEPL